MSGRLRKSRALYSPSPPRGRDSPPIGPTTVVVSSKKQQLKPVFEELSSASEPSAAVVLPRPAPVKLKTPPPTATVVTSTGPLIMAHSPNGSGYRVLPVMKPKSPVTILRSTQGPRVYHTITPDTSLPPDPKHIVVQPRPVLKTSPIMLESRAFIRPAQDLVKKSPTKASERKVVESSIANLPYNLVTDQLLKGDMVHATQEKGKMPEAEASVTPKKTPTKKIKTEEEPESGEPASELPVQSICAVCGGPAAGIHYGVTSCHGCKCFFRRLIDVGNKYQCQGDGSCVINPPTYPARHISGCRACRYKRCLEVGMSRESVRPSLLNRNLRRKKPLGESGESTMNNSMDVMDEDSVMSAAGDEESKEKLFLDESTDLAPQKSPKKTGPSPQEKKQKKRYSTVTNMESKSRSGTPKSGEPSTKKAKSGTPEEFETPPDAVLDPRDPQVIVSEIFDCDIDYSTPVDLIAAIADSSLIVPKIDNKFDGSRGAVSPMLLMANARRLATMVIDFVGPIIPFPNKTPTETLAIVRNSFPSMALLLVAYNSLSKVRRWQQRAACLPCGHVIFPDQNLLNVEKSGDVQKDKLVEEIKKRAQKVLKDFFHGVLEEALELHLSKQDLFALQSILTFQPYVPGLESRRQDLIKARDIVTNRVYDLLGGARNDKNARTRTNRLVMMASTLTKVGEAVRGLVAFVAHAGFPVDPVIVDLLEIETQ